MGEREEANRRRARALRDFSPRELRAALEAGADPNGEAGDGEPLRQACFGGRSDLVRILLEFGADPNRKGARGETALGVAALGRREWPCAEMIRDLARAGADLEEAGWQGNPPLVLAARFGNPEAARELLDLGAVPGVIGDRGIRAEDAAKAAGEEELEREIRSRRQAREEAGELGRSAGAGKARGAGKRGI